MTDVIKSRFDFYVQKTGSPPRFQNVMRDFKVSEQDARLLLAEYSGKSTTTVFPPNPAEPRKERIIKLSKDEFESVSNKKDNANDFHEVIGRQGWGEISIRIISGIVAAACLIRGASVIFEVNSFDFLYGILSSIIFQGGSAILPIIGMLYFSLTTKKKWFNAIIASFFMLGGLASMSYEVYASVANFHQLNVKQEISIKAMTTDVNDPIILAIQEKIDSQKNALAQTEAQLALRQKEYGDIGDSVTPESLKIASGRVSANKAQAEKESLKLQELLDEKTRRLVKLELSSDSNSSSINLVSNDVNTKNLFELWIMLIPSIMMVLFTPVFSSIAVFGINRR